MVAKEEAVAVIQARGDCGLDLSGGVEMGRGSGTEVYSIWKRNIFRLANALNVDWGRGDGRD